MEVGASQAVAGPRARGHPPDSMGKQMGRSNGPLGTGRPDEARLAGTRQDGRMVSLGGGELSAGRAVLGAQSSSPEVPPSLLPSLGSPSRNEGHGPGRTHVPESPCAASGPRLKALAAHERVCRGEV